MKAIDRKQFGETLREIRLQEGLTQADLAEACELSPMHISHFECGRRLPNLENFATLMRALGDYCSPLLDLGAHTPVHVFRGPDKLTNPRP